VVIETGETKYFYDLTPDRILSAVEAAGVRCTGRCLPLNSMENRVYEVEIEVADETSIRSPADRFRVVKFYRPGRWSRVQLEEEHRFLLDLEAAEIPVVAPLRFDDGETLRSMPGIDIFYAVFPKMGGRNPDELSGEQLNWIGRLLARIHTVGAGRPAPHRLRLTPQTYGLDNLAFLLESGAIPPELQRSYRDLVEQACTIMTPWFEGLGVQRIHGDCHFGNIVWASAGPFFVDFDDMVVGPPVQDIWLIAPGRDEQQLEALLAGYEQMRQFDRSTLRLIEPLRTLRFIHFSAWIARRWKDPAFQRVFTSWGTQAYWVEQIADLRDQLEIMTGPGPGEGGSAEAEEEDYWID